MAEYMGRLWAERAKEPPRFDLLSMLAHGPATRDMPLREFMGTLALLIVGGNDTTRNTMSGGLLALHRHPDQWARLRENPALLPGLVQETIRWQTPFIHMRRTACEDAELGGQHIGAGDKVVMWYVSGNRDEEAIDDPEGFVIDRPRPRHHLSFGSGIHRCVGDRAGRAAASGLVGGDREARPRDRRGGAAGTRLLELPARDQGLPVRIAA